jgi:hypothetical protein
MTGVIRQLEKDLASALASAKLAPTFQEWIQQVIDEQECLLEFIANSFRRVG